eukprot:515132-Ditylum_brightwellii.AAC.1
MVQSGGSPQDASTRQASKYSRMIFDRSQGNHLVMTRMQVIYLVDLEGPNAYCHDLNAWYIDSTLICLIVPAPQGHINMYHKKDRKTSSSTFTR